MSSVISGEAIFRSGVESVEVSRGFKTATIAARTPDLDPMPTLDGLPLYRLTIAQYDRMAEVGILEARAPVVLINGLLVAKMPINPPHRIAGDSLNMHLVRRLPDGWHVSVANPVILPDSESVPEPDLKVVRGGPNDYASAHPKGTDLAVVIEVSDSTLRADQTRMKRIYAEGLVPYYWIVNLRGWRIEVYSDPTGPDPEPDYRRLVNYGLEDQIPIFLDGVEVFQIAVSDILPRERNA